MLYLNFFTDIGDALNKALIVDNRYLRYMEGLLNTMIISFGALIVGLIFGLGLSLILYLNKKTGKLKIATKIANIYVTVVRGIPAVLQMLIAAYAVLTFMLGVWDGILVAMIAFGINSSAYVCEIFRGGLEAVDDGQMEAGKALGFNTTQIMINIILPQAIKKALPPFGNEFITLIKETSVVGYIGLLDLTKAANGIAALTYDAFTPLIIAAIIYLGLVMLLTYFLKEFERYLSKGDREEGGEYGRKEIRKKAKEEKRAN